MRRDSEEESIKSHHQRLLEEEVHVGFLNGDDLENVKWMNLISGIGWLVRNGEDYVNQSTDLDLTSDFVTGIFNSYIFMIMIGFDRKSSKKFGWFVLKWNCFLVPSF